MKASQKVWPTTRETISGLEDFLRLKDDDETTMENISRIPYVFGQKERRKFIACSFEGNPEDFNDRCFRINVYGRVGYEKARTIYFGVTTKHFQKKTKCQ